MKGYYLQFHNVHFGKLFDRLEDAIKYAEEMNKIGLHGCCYSILEV